VLNSDATRSRARLEILSRISYYGQSARGMIYGESLCWDPRRLVGAIAGAAPVPTVAARFKSLIMDTREN